MRPLTGVRVATSWLTVMPVGTPKVSFDRRLGPDVIAAAPLVGLAIGGAVAGLGYLLTLTALPTLLCATIVVAALALMTRGMHIDGLADTVDALGCYGDTDRVRRVLKDPAVGPFGVAAIVLTLLVQIGALATLMDRKLFWAIIFAIVVSRVAAVVCCRRSLPPLSPTGFGGLVAGTTRGALIWCPAVIAAGVVATPDLRWLGPVAAAVALGAVWLFSAHVRRRFGGINGDVMGASIEVSLTLTLLILAAATSA